MYRLGYIDLVQDKASVIPLWFLLSCILFAVVVLYLVLKNIRQPLQLGDNIKKLIEEVKLHRRKWIWCLVLILGMFVGGYYDSKKSETIPETYSSPEEAYANVYPENTLQLKLEGRDSCLLIGSNSSRHDHLMVVEQDDEWICETSSAVKIQEGHLDTRFYYYYQYGEYDNYLVVRTARGDECIVQDAFESEFIRIESEKTITGDMYCTYLEDYSEDYWVSINGTRVTFEGK